MWQLPPEKLLAYTGAGISTSSGIPDYRGPNGVWTLKSQGKRPPPVAYSQVQPSSAHRALALLVQAGLVNHVVTQNVDGLHRASGVPEGKLSELHGSARRERCAKCGQEYLRESATWSVTGGDGSSAASARVKRRRANSGPQPTAVQRQCENPGCSGPLRHCVTMFGEPLPEFAVLSAERETVRADAALVLGSSLRVRPACDYPATVAARGGKLVIVNLQSTPLDAKADLIIRRTCDEVMESLVLKLGFKESISFRIMSLRDSSTDEDIVGVCKGKKEVGLYPCIQSQSKGRR